MGPMKLNHVKACSNSPLSRGTKCFHCLLDLLERHFPYRRKRFRVKWNGAGPPYIVRPPANVLMGNAFGALFSVSGSQCASFPSSVGELDTGLVPLGMNKVCDALEWSNVAILPKASVFWRDSAMGLNTGGLENGERSAPHAKRTQVNEMPVREVAIVGRVLTLGEDVSYKRPSMHGHIGPTMGDTTKRFTSVIPRIVSGRKSVGVASRRSGSRSSAVPLGGSWAGV